MRNAGRGRRLRAAEADFAIMTLGLVVGWLLWLRRLPAGQSPGKSLLGLAIHTTDGQPTSAARIAIRGLFNWLMFAGPVLILILVRVLEPSDNPGNIWAVLTAIALVWLIATVLGAATMLVLKGGRGISDRIFGTVVVEREE